MSRPSTRTFLVVTSTFPFSATTEIRDAPFPKGACAFPEVSGLNQSQLPLGFDRLHWLEFAEGRYGQRAFSPAERQRRTAGHRPQHVLEYRLVVVLGRHVRGHPPLECGCR